MSFASPPGTLIAFGGPLSQTNAQLLADAGWLYCDGSSYRRTDYPLLYAAIGNNYGGAALNFNVPDLRGRFLRGTDHGAGRDPDASTRTASALGGNSGDAVGSAQASATGLPWIPFVTSEQPDHSHTVSNQPISDGHTAKGASGPASTDAMEWTSDSSDTDEDPAHDHTINSGGDSESRPDNIYLMWFIKALSV